VSVELPSGSLRFLDEDPESGSGRRSDVEDSIELGLNLLVETAPEEEEEGSGVVAGSKRSKLV